MSRTSFRTHNDLTTKIRGRILPLLNQQLADTTDLFTQVKTSHWNVKGPHFIALHLLFDTLAGKLVVQADAIAERATALGGVATGTLRQAAKASRLPELPAGTFDGMTLVRALTARYGQLASDTRTAIDAATTLGDTGTADLLTGVSRELDSSLWFLEAHLQNG
ncbi:MAG: DNA starvation/stationary phase protection protein Dps [Gemmatimonadota bacterium]